MRLVLEVYMYEGRHLSNDASSLKEEGLYRKHTVKLCDIFYVVNLSTLL